MLASGVRQKGSCIVGRERFVEGLTVVVGGLRGGCHLLDLVDSLCGVGICSIRRMVV